MATGSQDFESQPGAPLTLFFNNMEERTMSSDIDRSDVVWIVTASNHYWGASNSLHEAMKNANLPEPKSPAEFFAEELEYSFDVSEALASWKDFGKEESSAPSGDVITVIVHRFDPGLWSDYNVSGIDGGVTFTHREDMEADWDAEMKKATIVADYKDGVMTPKAA